MSNKDRFRCPHCGSEEDLGVLISAVAKLSPDGTVKFDPDQDYTYVFQYDPAICGKCDYGIDLDVPICNFYVEKE